MATKSKTAVKSRTRTVSRPSSKESRLRTVAKAVGLNLEKAGKGWRLVDSVTGTLVADDWSGDDGLSLEAIEQALRG